MKKIIIKYLYFFFSLIYSKQYLKGRWFDNSYQGWIWCFKGILFQKIIRINSHCPFPVSPMIKISNNLNIDFHPDNLDNFQGIGNYYQCEHASIIFGHGTYIANNVGIITANHNIDQLDKHVEGKSVIIGKNCWIGMNSILLPGVELGDKTIVGAGSVVTKSFKEGNCVIAGNPAKLIKRL